MLEAGTLVRFDAADLTWLATVVEEGDIMTRVRVLRVHNGAAVNPPADLTIPARMLARA